MEYSEAECADEGAKQWMVMNWNEGGKGVRKCGGYQKVEIWWFGAMLGMPRKCEMLHSHPVPQPAPY